MLLERFKEHRQATNDPNHSDATAAVPTHFNLPGHCAKDMRLIPLELQRSSNNGSRRKAREAYLVERGKILSPQMALTDKMDVNYFCFFLLLYMYPVDRSIDHIYSYMHSNILPFLFTFQFKLFVAVVFNLYASYVLLYRLRHVH